MFNHQHPRQKAINDAVAQELIIGCSLPLSIVENSHFQRFMKTVEPRYKKLPDDFMFLDKI